jgi:acyl-CoA synthetase (AMP-forming)/AMP-acid ligase II
MSNISTLFFQAAKAHPRQPAIIENDRCIAYGQLEREVKRTAAYFARKGIQKGDRVLVFVPMGMDLYRVVLALFSLGAVAVFLDEWVSWKRMELCCQLADCRGFIGIRKARIFGFFSGEIRKIPIWLHPKMMNDDTIGVEEMGFDDAALITFTTGSSGTPKAALRSHGFLHEQFKALKAEIHPKPGDIDMTVLPIVLFINLGVGATSVIAPYNQRKPHKNNWHQIADQISEHRVERIIASPHFIASLASYSRTANRPFTAVKQVFTGGAPVFPAEAAGYVNAFPQATSTIAYGSTEAEPISLITAEELAGQSTAVLGGLPVGMPTDLVDVAIVNIVDAPIAQIRSITEIALDEGEIGEIVVSGPHVLKTYYKNEPAWQRNKIIAGKTTWHRTGDSGFRKDGMLHLTGPCNRLIRRGGKIISPFLAEDELKQLPDVNAGTILEINKEVVVVIEATGSQSGFTHRVTFPFDHIEFVNSIPRDPRHHSKIDYEALKRLLQKM